MKKFILAMMAVCLVGGLFCSCEHEDPFANTIYGPTYTYNYYWENVCKEDVSINFTSFDQGRRMDQIISKQFTLAPQTSIMVDQFTKRAYTKIDGGKPMPVYGIEDARWYVFYDVPTEGYEFSASIQIGNNPVISFSPEEHKDIFITDNYRAEIENDTTFHFYFTIDEEYISTFKP